MNARLADKKRVVLADALRGYALMGLFLVHMVEYFELYWYQPDPGWVHTTLFFLFGGKAYGLFALLFGLSFYFILKSYDDKAYDFRWRFIWRISLLLGVGYLHSLLYAGDILQILALAGILLVLTHRLTDRWIGIIALFMLLQLPIFICALVYQFGGSGGIEQPRFFALMGANFQAFAHGSLAEVLQHNAWQGQLAKWAFFLETGRIWNVIGLMFAGVYCGRKMVFERQQSVKTLAMILVAAIACYFLVKGLSQPVINLFDSSMGRWTLEQGFGYLNNLCLIAVTLVIFIAIFQWRPGAKVLAWFAPAGRMTLSFYLIQSCIFVPFYYGFGAGAYTWLGQEFSLLLGVVLWLVQLVVANWYLQRKPQGPLEWLWRRATMYKLNLPNTASTHVHSSSSNKVVGNAHE